MNIDLKLVAFLLSLAATAFAITLGVAVGSGEYLYPSIAAGGFAAIFLMSNPPVAAACAVATFSSGVTIPGLPGQMRLFDVFALALIAIFILNSAMKAGKRIPFSRLDWILVIFCGWMFFIGSYRGFGFLAFGADMIGGFNYLRLFFAASLVITLPRIGLPSGSWKIVWIFAGILAPATLIADLLIMKGWAFNFVRIFVQTTQQTNDMAGGPESVGRLFSAGAAATGMMLALLCLVPMRRFFQFTGIPWLILFAAIVTLSLLSGFRLMTASLILIAGLTLYFQKGLTPPRILTLFVAGCVGIFAVYFFSTSLPNSVQRAVSWLPGIEVSSIASGDANQTVEWRIRLWQEALRYFPDYWLVGKGLSYNMLDYIAANQVMYTDDLRWALVSGSYHNGWLSMLLLTGVFGTVLCLILLVAPIRRHWKRQFAPWRSSLFKRFHGVLLAMLISTVAAYFLLYGEVHTSFPVVFFNWAVLETLSRADAEAPLGADIDEAHGDEHSESTYQEA